MKDWVTRIRSVLEEMQGKEEPVSLPSEPLSRAASTRRDTIIPEPLYASIREESIHRSNSLSTLPSLCRDPLGDEGGDWHNRSMDEGPVCGLGGVDHNLTYNYSSSEVTVLSLWSNLFNQSLHFSRRA